MLINLFNGNKQNTNTQISPIRVTTNNDFRILAQASSTEESRVQNINVKTQQFTLHAFLSLLIMTQVA
jgi:hypothetical protein